jgi:hypothetical protein
VTFYCLPIVSKANDSLDASLSPSQHASASTTRITSLPVVIEPAALLPQVPLQQTFPIATIATPRS